MPINLRKQPEKHCSHVERRKDISLCIYVSRLQTLIAALRLSTLHVAGQSHMHAARARQL